MMYSKNDSINLKTFDNTCDFCKKNFERIMIPDFLCNKMCLLKSYTSNDEI